MQTRDIANLFYSLRNDTGKSVNIETRQPNITLENLYPGAGYEIKVYALSHDLLR